MAAKQLSQLVKMANQIACNLGAGHDDLAAQRTAEHIIRFWTPDMRRHLIEFWLDGGEVTPEVAASLDVLHAQENKRRQTV